MTVFDLRQKRELSVDLKVSDLQCIVGGADGGVFQPAGPPIPGNYQDLQKVGAGTVASVVLGLTQLPTIGIPAPFTQVVAIEPTAPLKIEGLPSREES